MYCPNNYQLSIIHYPLLPKFLLSLHLVSSQFGVVFATHVENAAFSRSFTVFDDHVVAATVETDEHLVIAWYERTFVVCGLIVNVITRIVGIVEVQFAL